MMHTDEVTYEQAIRSVDKIAPKTHHADEDAYRWAIIYNLCGPHCGVPDVDFIWAEPRLSSI